MFRSLRSIKLPKQSRNSRNITIVACAAGVAIIGSILLLQSHAATPAIALEPESGQTSNGATVASSSAASGGQYVQFSAGSSSNPSGPLSSMCNSLSGTPQVNKVMVIWEENDDFADIIGSGQAPYMDSLASNCALATNYYAYTHPSLPNYMAVTSGVKYNFSPWDNDCNPPDGGCTTSAANIFSGLGTNWKGYAESMPGNCYKNSSGNYEPRHNPPVYYTNMSSNCANQDVPLGTTSSGNLLNDIKNGLPKLSSVTPNMINDMHDGTLQDADNWLSKWMPIITNGADYQSGHLAVFLAWDEGTGGGDTSSRTVVIAINPYIKKGTQASARYDDFSFSRTLSELTGQSPLGDAASSSSMKTAFGL